MIFGLFRSKEPAPPTRAEAAYAAIVAAARRPALFQQLGAPDTLPGRFEMIVLHAALCMRRLRADGSPEALRFSQELFDTMFRELDANMREMGVGDMAVPKRIKAMARSFFDGAAAYDIALDAADADRLAEALRRIVYAKADQAGEGPVRLAAYAVAADARLREQSAEALITEGPVFPEPEGARA